MPENLLSDPAIRKAAPREKPWPLPDGGGLALEVQPEGGKWWRWRYRFEGKEKMLSMGTYPAVTLAEARKRRDEARALLASGINPSDARKAGKARRQRQQEIAVLVAAGAALPGTFESVAREWLAKVHEPAVSERYALRSRVQLEKDVFPWIGQRQVGEVSAPMVLDLLRKVEARGALDTAHRVKQTIGLVMRYAIATGHAERDPTPDLRGALTVPIKTHYAAILEPARVGELLRAIDGYTGQPGTRAALQLAALFFQRPGNIRQMQWAHIDLDAGEWVIPSQEMKRTKQEKASAPAHLVPLSTQAAAILRALYPLTSASPFCFPGLRSRARPLSDGTINAALRRMGFPGDEMTGHGFRAMARTVIAEQIPGVDTEWIEAQLAHGKKGPLGAAYDRAKYVAQRRRMMQVWADYLDRLREGAQVLPFKAA